ncbi:MAG: hypothetical protein EOO00_09405, partial [Chitinophagaceae bacterium]
MSITLPDQPLRSLERADTVQQCINRMDWSVTPVGDRSLWPQALIAAIDTVLGASYPVFLFWGKEHTFFYNDAAASLFPVAQQPGHLYTQALYAWPDMWYRIQSIVDEVLQGSPTPLLEDLSIPIYRKDTIEEAYWNLNFSGIKESTGTVAGVMVACIESTKKVLLLREALEAKSQLKEVLEGSDLGTWELDPVTMVFNCNQKTKEIFGLSSDQYVDLQVAVDMIEQSD